MSEELTWGLVERLAWVEVSAEKPDADTTVMLYVPGGDEEVWPGYLDGEVWLWAEGVPVDGEVVAWCEMPRGLGR